MVECSFCGTKNEDTARHCQECGKSLGGPSQEQDSSTSEMLGFEPQEMGDSRIVCPSCGEENEAAMRFCEMCRAELHPRQDLTTSVINVSEQFASPPTEPLTDRDMMPLPKNVSKAQEAVKDKCPKCGAHIQWGNRFCGKCGTKTLSPRLASAGASSSRSQPEELSTGSETLVYKASAEDAENREKEWEKIVLVEESSRTEKEYRLAGSETRIGRGQADVTIPTDELLSRCHASLLCRKGQLLLKDNGSVNGTFIRIKEPLQLSDGDIILVGEQLLRFESDLLRKRCPQGSDYSVASREIAQSDPRNAPPQQNQSQLAADQEPLDRSTDADQSEDDFTQQGTIILNDSESVPPDASGTGEEEDETKLFVSKGEPAAARLVRILPNNVEQDFYLSSYKDNLIGRQRGDMIFGEDSFMSSTHSKIYGSDGEFFLEDMGSKNGTLIKIKDQVELVPGDRFRVGEQVFRVELTEE